MHTNDRVERLYGSHDFSISKEGMRPGLMTISMTMTKINKYKSQRFIKLHLALHRFTVKFTCRSFHHLQYTFILSIRL